ncbi:MAG TPA: diguanylate cyclase, partial [Candidatus Acidoferrum sp.]|nr:diguanylate cyclase [Candidatus Acidoferrum sp.]
MRFDRTWIIRVLLGAGAIASLAAYLYLGHREATAAAQFRVATRDRADAIRREIESRATLLGVVTRLLSRDGASTESVQDVIDGYRGARGEGVMAFWTPWGGVGDPPTDWGSVRRFTSAWTPVPGSAPAWLDDALRRVAHGNRTITVPAATPEDAELLIFAAPVNDARGSMKGVAMIAARVSEVVEQALGRMDPAGIEVVAEDVTLGGRRIYARRSRVDDITFDVPIRFADRVWTLHAASVPDRDSRTRSILLVACLLMAFLSAMARKRPAEEEPSAPTQPDESLHDPLTGLPNRRLFDDRMEQSLAEARRAGSTFAVYYLDLDGFDPAADAVLIEIARRLRDCLRASDTLARVGGDEFAVIAPHLHETGDSERVACKLLDCVALPCRAGGREITLAASIGVALFPRHSSDARELLQSAQAALVCSQRHGGNRFTMFTPELGHALRERIEMEGELRGAAERGEIVVHYQPEYDLCSGRLTGFASRARWKHPERGMISPARFIPVAEDSGLIVPVGLSVLEQSCRAAVRWQKPGLPPVRATVKVSGVQFVREDFVESVGEILKRTGLPPELLQLEIAESAVRTGVA